MKFSSFLSKFPQLKKWPSKSQWMQFFKVLNKNERIFFLAFLSLFLGSALFLICNSYFKNTEIEPAFGGSFAEGALGHPRLINPIYGEVSDADRDLVQLIFAGLMKYDSSGKIVPDLIKEYKILEGGKIFEIYLKENVLWQDEEKLTADDVIFTIETIQNPEYKSPLRAAWVGVETEKISEFSLRLKLKNPSAVFLENLTLKILPFHIWQNIPPESFPLSVYNLRPVGSGSYQLKNIRQDKLGNIKFLTLTENINYFGEKPKIKEIVFYFYNTEEELIKAAKRREIQNFSLVNPDSFEFFKKRGSNSYVFSLPRYFAVFFNPDKSEVLANDKVRQALNYGTNKEEIVKTVFGDKGEVANSPILPEIYGFKNPTKIYEFNVEKAKEILDKAGFVEKENACETSAETESSCGQATREKIIKIETISKFKSDLKLGSQGSEVKELQRCLSVPPAGGPDIYPEKTVTGIFDQKTKDAVIKFQEKYAKEILEPGGIDKGTGIVSKNTRTKLNELCDLSPKKTQQLKISLVTVNQSPLIEVANILKRQWAALGAEITVETFDSQTAEDIIKNRNYDALLFGEVLSSIPDPLPYWHSLQKKDPGLNLSLYENKEADKLLEGARQSLNSEDRAQKLEKFQDILLSSAPAVFLYSQDYIYLTSKQIKGITETMIVDPSKRFSGIESWYIKTRRVRK